MEILILSGIVCLAAWAYSRGKRTGSKKAYHVGRRHGRRR